MANDNEFFGVDLKQTIGEATKDQLNKGTLTRKEEAGYDPIEDETTYTETDYTFDGFVSSYDSYLISDGVVQGNDREITIIADSLDVIPTNGTGDVQADDITIEGNEFTVVRVPDRDPAAATYKVQGRM